MPRVAVVLQSGVESMKPAISGHVPKDTVGELGELALIERLCPRFPAGGDILVGAGDDCAVVRPDPGSSEDWVLKSDPVISGRHFFPGADPFQIGHKAVGRVLSDLAAMGAVPRWALLNLVLSKDIPIATIDAVYDGMLTLANRYGLAFVGGDTSQGSELALHVFACGSVPRGTARLRSGAAVGDGVYVTGLLGGSLSGRHLTFEPRIREGCWLRDRVNAMIDISDGLASELWHLAKASAVEIEVTTDRIPVSAEALLAGQPLTAALYDGEDFELLFTVPGEKEEEFLPAWTERFPALPCTRIGLVRAASREGGVWMRDRERVELLSRGGFEHFRR